MTTTATTTTTTMRCKRILWKSWTSTWPPFSLCPPLITTLYIRAWAIYIHIYYIPMYSEIIWANPCFVKSSDLFCFKVKKKLCKHTQGVYLQRFLLPSRAISPIGLKKNNSVNVLFGMRIVIYPFYYYSYGYYYYY